MMSRRTPMPQPVKNTAAQSPHLEHDVVTRNGGLVWDGDRLFLEGVHVRHAIQQRDQQVKSRAERPVKLPEPLNHIRFLLRHNHKPLRGQNTVERLEASLK